MLMVRLAIIHRGCTGFDPSSGTASFAETQQRQLGDALKAVVHRTTASRRLVLRLSIPHIVIKMNPLRYATTRPASTDKQLS